MMHLVAVAMLASAAPNVSDTLSDEALIVYASQPYDKGAMEFHHDVLGIHHGTEVVADFPCSDICPTYTVRIIHYSVEPGPDCDRIGGVTQIRTVPVSIAVMRRPFCVPKVLAEKKLE